jgi:hypothetical protein
VNGSVTGHKIGRSNKWGGQTELFEVAAECVEQRMFSNGSKGEASGKGVRQPGRLAERWARASCAGQDFRLFAWGKRHGMIRFHIDYPICKLSAVSSRGNLVVHIAT